MSTLLVWLITAATVACILIRPKRWPEFVWACCGAALLLLLRLIPVSIAVGAIEKGTDVYLFLAGMMLLAELARREGVFNWLADLAVRSARSSRSRLFDLIYAVGILVTVLLSNDATAVVLTPAVYAATTRARTNPLPYLLICAFIANAASFVLPISNPANLVVYGKTLPPLLPWLRTFLAPSVVSIVVTWVALRWFCRFDIKGMIDESNDERPVLSKGGHRAAWGIVATAIVLIGASAAGRNLGWPTLLCGVAVMALATGGQTTPMLESVREISWGVLPLVGGLFVIVDALNTAGAVNDIVAALHWASGAGESQASLATAFATAIVCNIVNNLPAGLLAGSALQAAHVAPHIRDSVLVGVDLGPNLSVTGSLATVLWLIALRREGEDVGALEFLRAGAVVMTPALLLATITLSLLRN